MDGAENSLAAGVDMGDPALNSAAPVASVSAHLEQLATVAERRGHAFLTFLIGLAALEARDLEAD